jgi:hypothetical protein
MFAVVCAGVVYAYVVAVEGEWLRRCSRWRAKVACIGGAENARATVVRAGKVSVAVSIAGNEVRWVVNVVAQ